VFPYRNKINFFKINNLVCLNTTIQNEKLLQNHLNPLGEDLGEFIRLLIGSFKKVRDLRVFTGFQVGYLDLSVSHLQYADDILFIGEALMANVWSLKTILRCVGLT